MQLDMQACQAGLAVDTMNTSFVPTHCIFYIPNAPSLHSCVLVQKAAHGASAGSLETTHDSFWHRQVCTIVPSDSLDSAQSPVFSIDGHV